MCRKCKGNPTDYTKICLRFEPDLSTRLTPSAQSIPQVPGLRVRPLCALDEPAEGECLVFLGLASEGFALGLDIDAAGDLSPGAQMPSVESSLRSVRRVGRAGSDGIVLRMDRGGNGSPCAIVSAVSHQQETKNQWVIRA